MTSLRILFAVLPLSLVALPAAAYKFQHSQTSGATLRWRSLPVRYNIHTRAAPGTTLSQTISAIRAAYSAWSQVSCTNYRATDLGTINLPSGNKSDGINTHVWLAYWPSNYGQNALGVTKTYYNPTSGQITDADTHYNPSVSWSVNGALSRIDVQSVATHEIGHQLGLAHSPIQAATMFYATGRGDTSQRSLHSDDIAAVCALYPGGGTKPPECTSNTDCAPNEVCTNNKCVISSSGGKGYGGSCPNGPKDCKSGLCLRSGGDYFCTQRCATQSCPNSDRCVAVSSSQGTLKACLPNSANRGTKQLGQSCQTSQDCKSNICVSVPGKGYLCSQQCSLSNDNCPSTFQCAKTTSGGGLCIPKTQQGGSGGTTTQKKKLGQSCSSGTECASSLCAKTSDGQVCISRCDLSKPNCPSGFTCERTSDAGRGACVAKTSSGTKTGGDKGSLGDGCKASSECQSNICINDHGSGVCTTTCSASGSCPEGYRCASIGGGKHACSPDRSTQAAEGDGGCAMAGGALQSWPSQLLPLGLLLLLLGCGRRRTGDS